MSLYRKLGFGFQRCPLPSSGQALSSVQIFDIGWADRLRILWSGIIAVEVLVHIDHMPKNFGTTSLVSVPEPGWRGIETMTTDKPDGN